MPLTTLQQSLAKIEQLPLEHAFWYLLSLLDPSKDLWQYWDMLHAVHAQESCWIRSRGGSKTDDAVQLAIFLGLRFGNGGWYSCDGGQIDEARQRMKDYHPWVVKVNQYQAHLANGARILFGKYGGKRGLRGPRNHWLISDEEGEISTDKAILHGYEGAMATTSTYKEALKLHMGTPKIGSKLHDNALLFPSLYRPPQYCHWVDVAQYKHMPQWWQDAELYCKWVMPGGSVFTPVTAFSFPAQYQWQSQGVDFNGTANSNVAVRIGRVNMDTYVLHEDAFQYKLDDALLQRYCDAYPTEVESGGWNTIYAPNLKGVTTMSFGESVQIGEKRIGIKEWLITELNKGTLYIDKQLTPKTYQAVIKAVWGKDEKVDVNDLHYLAALLHAFHKHQGTLTAPKLEKVQWNALQGRYV